MYGVGDSGFGGIWPSLVLCDRLPALPVSTRVSLNLRSSSVSCKDTWHLAGLIQDTLMSRHLIMGWRAGPGNNVFGIRMRLELYP